MEKEKISSLQLFYILIGFEFGTAIILGLGAGAEQDAWIVILVSTLLSIVLMSIYVKLASFYPNMTLIEIIPKLIGKYLAYPFIYLYLTYFVYTAGRACRDFGDLIGSTILVETPIIIVIGSFMVLVIYCLRGGIEIFGRMGEIVFPIFMISLIIVWILLLSVKSIQFSNLNPILGNGVKPILKEVFPKNINFPFGETIIIMMFIPNLQNQKNAGKVGFAVILIGGILLTINSVLILSVVGPELYKIDYFPLLSATRLVSIADFLERFDALIILMMVAGVFFKVGAWMYGAAVGIAQLFNVKSKKSIILGIGTIIIPLSLLIGRDFVTHLEIAFKFLNIYVLTLMHIILPILFFCIAFIRKKVLS
ncbi:GerAB/ArcD/ProY family transporter [Metabacillus sp. FJAT-53654]|uniref:GerAB/ArcD/ProY family transporter n=1 Tax=Metabacillus rhizosphaerae TaxID=3117747 RepID=A0ABZ2MUB1_9BACI